MRLNLSVLLGSLLLVACSSSGPVNLASPPGAITPTPSASVIPAVPSSIPVAINTLPDGWKRYEGANFSVALPSTWKVLPVTTDGLSEVLAGVPSDDRAQITYMVEGSIANGAKFFAYDTDKSHRTLGLIPNFNIILQAGVRDYPFDLVAESNVKQLPTLKGFIEPANHKRLTLANGKPVEEVRYKLDVSGNVQLALVQYLTVASDLLFVLTFSGPVAQSEAFTIVATQAYIYFQGH